MSIEPFQSQDLSFLPELRPEGWPDIIPAFNFYLKSFHCYPVKVIQNNCIAGIGALVLHQHTAWLAHIIVHKEMRNQGMGRMITETLVKNARSKGCETINLIATDLGAPVYEKVGFETEMEYLFFKNVNIKQDSSEHENVVPYTPDFRDQVAELDKIASSEERFFFINPHLKEAMIYLKQNKVEGYYLPTLGEGLIIAKTAEAGLELAKLRLRTHENASFPVTNNVLTDFLLAQQEFEPFKTAKRMRLGTAKPWRPEYMFNRIGGNVG